MNAASDVETKTATPVTAEAPEPALKKRRARRRILMTAVPLALAVAGGAFWLMGGRYEGTENANLEQARIAVAADESGRVVTVDVSNNQRVRKGDVLFQIDPQPYKIGLEQANASLAAARLKVQQLRAAYEQARAQVKVVSDDVTFYQTEYNRQEALKAKGIASESALDSARRNLRKAEENKISAEQAVLSAKAALGGNPDIPTEEHPAVLAALAARDKAQYDLSQTTVRAPADGIVYKASSFKPGQFVAAGSPLFSLVETGDTWVQANFKETQLTHMKPGQSADVTFDTYPGRTFKARVTAIGAGTGAEFSLLPAQNATGNWVKVTQRVPVFLRLENPDPKVMLRTGMSASVSVDTKVSRSLSALLPAALGGTN